jgi:hypothetical protein
MHQAISLTDIALVVMAISSKPWQRRNHLPHKGVVYTNVRNRNTFIELADEIITIPPYRDQ